VREDADRRVPTADPSAATEQAVASTPPVCGVCTPKVVIAPPADADVADRACLFPVVVRAPPADENAAAAPFPAEIVVIDPPAEAVMFAAVPLRQAITVDC
jgi:hypothetical protein